MDDLDSVFEDDENDQETVAAPSFELKIEKIIFIKKINKDLFFKKVQNLFSFRYRFHSRIKSFAEQRKSIENSKKQDDLVE